MRQSHDTRSTPRTTLNLVFLFAFSLPGGLRADSSNPSSPHLTVKIEGLRTAKGGVQLTLFKKEDEKAYPIQPEKAAFSIYRDLASSTELVLTVPLSQPGEYAAFAYHDENGDRKLNTNLVGIPKEGYGASEGATNSFGPPRYSEAKFEFGTLSPNSKTAISIPIKY